MEERKSNKGLIWLLIILIVLVLGVVSFIIYDKLIKEEAEYGTKEEIIKQNFLNDINLVKKGKGTEEQKYLFCSDIYNCENIDEFNIENIEFYENGEDNKPVYKIKLSWSCKGEGECFYNEQYGYNDEKKLNEIETFYKVDEDNKIIECLGNSYDITEVEYDIELKDLNFPTENDNTVLVYGHVNEFIDENIKKSLDMFENYKNVSYKINGFNFEESCTDYLDQVDGPSYCRNSEMTIDEKIKINFSLDIPYSEQKFIMITDKNIIVQKGLGAITLGAIEVYDYEGNLIKTIENTTDYLVLHGKNCEILYNSNMSYNMKLTNNKLHYIDASEGAIYKTLDLKTFEENIIGSINASTSQQC